MKTLTRLALALLLLLVGVAPVRAQDSLLDNLTLDDFVTYFNMAAPVDMGTIGVLEKIEYDKTNKLFIYYLDYNDSFVPISQVKENLKKGGGSLLATMYNESSAPMFRKLVDEDVSLQMRYKGRNSGETVLQTITPHEMRLAMADTRDPRVKAQERYNTELTNTRAATPMDMGNGMTMTDVFDDNGYMVYVYTVDEDALPFDVLNKNMQNPDMRNNLIKTLASDPASGSLIDALIALDKGLLFRYVANRSGKKFELSYPSYELKMYR